MLCKIKINIMNYQIYLGTAGLNSQCLPHILYHWAGGTVKHHQADSQTEIFKIPRKKKHILWLF